MVPPNWFAKANSDDVLDDDMNEWATTQANARVTITNVIVGRY